MSAQRMVVFDLETTSQWPTEAHIVTAFLGILEPDGTVSREQQWLVNPGVDIPAETTAIHGITNEKAIADGVHPLTALKQIEKIIYWECHLNRLPLVGQNIVYDLTVLDREIRRHHTIGTPTHLDLSGINVLDSLVLDKALFKYRKGAGARKLVNLAAAYGVPITEEEAHEARADAVAAGRIVQKQLQMLKGLPLAEVHHRQIQWKAAQSADLQAYFRKQPGKENEVVDPHWPIQPYQPAETKEAA